MTTPLQQAAQAILARWDAPASTQQILTGEHIYEQLRKALDAELQQSVEPVAWLRNDDFKAMVNGEKESWIESGNADVVEDYDKPLYLHHTQPQDELTEDEIAQSVEPDFYTACAEHNGGWIPLLGYSDETVIGVKSLILEDSRKEGWRWTIAGRLLSLGWQVMPVYLHPPQPQAAPDLLEALQNLLNSICNPEFGGEIDRKLACIDARTAIKAAKGEKP